MKAIKLLALLVLGMWNTQAQPFAIDGHAVVAAGGGEARGGTFELTATIGQPDAGPRLAGGCWSIEPGFWSAYIALPTLGAPTLRVRWFTSDYVRVSFTPDCGEWVLQWTRTLESAATVWTDDPASNLIVNGDELVRDFHVPSWGPRLFFRLRRPQG